MMRLIFSLAATALMVSGAVAPAQDELRFPSVIGDEMVLQRDHANPIWGWAKPGEEVIVTIAAHLMKATAGADGRWRVMLPKMRAQSKPTTIRGP